MIAVALGLLMAIQDPEPKPAEPTPPPAPAAQAPVLIEEWTDKQARDALQQFDELTEDKKASLAKRMQAVELFATGSHQKLVKPLQQMIVADAAVIVRVRAAELLAHQPEKEARPALLKLVQNERVEDQPPVQAAVVRSLSKCGYEERDWTLLDGLFARDYAVERLDLQRAILELITTHKEKQAIDLLLDNLDPPEPANPDDPANPPAEYWKARWEAWQVWHEQVKAALYAITEQQFSTREEARAWLKQNGRKIGIR